MVTKKVWANNGFEMVAARYGRSLEHMPHAQAGITHVDRDGESYDLLISYTTPVAWVNNDGWYGCNGTYSVTTRKHIGAFAKEYGLTYYDFKTAFEGGIEINRYTGEVRSL